MSGSDIEAELDHLYGLPLDEFTNARNDLARRLAKAGDRETAARVKELAKPTLVPWVVNQLRRERPDDVEALLAATRRLRETQAAILAGAPAGELADATNAERDALRRLTAAASEVLRRAGRSPGGATVDRVSAMLRAAALDEEASELLARGRLTHELEPSGFWPLDLPPGIVVAPRAQARKPPVEDERRRVAALRRELAEAKRTLAERERTAKQATRDAEAAEASAWHARSAVDQALAMVERLEAAFAGRP